MRMSDEIYLTRQDFKNEKELSLNLESQTIPIKLYFSPEAALQFHLEGATRLTQTRSLLYYT